MRSLATRLVARTRTPLRWAIMTLNGWRWSRLEGCWVKRCEVTPALIMLGIRHTLCINGSRWLGHDPGCAQIRGLDFVKEWRRDRIVGVATYRVSWVGDSPLRHAAEGVWTKVDFNEVLP